jgi:hypothetical protein
MDAPTRDDNAGCLLVAILVGILFLATAIAILDDKVDKLLEKRNADKVSTANDQPDDRPRNR